MTSNKQEPSSSSPSAAPTLPSSNLASSLNKSVSSWGAAFSSAAAVKPHDLGDFNPPSVRPLVDTTTTTSTGGSTSTSTADHGTNANKDPNYLARNHNGGMPKPKYGAPGNVMGVSAIAQQMMEAKKKLDSSNQIDIDINIDNNPTKSSVKKKEKKKKRKVEEVVLLLGDKKLVEEDHHHPPVKKAKKKKSKKEKKALKKKISRNSMDVDVGVEDEVAHDAEEDSIHKDFDDVSSTITSPLEGQMVMHQGESIFVLIDASKCIVYAMKRSESGGLVPIGKVSADGIVHITVTKCAADNEEDFPFNVDPDDHCESPLNSYKHIQPILDHLTSSTNIARTKDHLSIYDPYYCNGLVKDNLKQLGYANVYNKKEDAYETWDDKGSTDASVSQPYPSYHVFITNPPYSGDHPERLMEHLTRDPRTRGKPWLLLMPQYIHKKDYYKAILFSKKNKEGIQPFYLVPKKRYVYLPPKDFREKKESDVHKKSSPFVSMWYIWGGSREKTEELIKAYEKNGDGGCELARSTSALRDLRRKGKRK